MAGCLLHDNCVASDVLSGAGILACELAASSQAGSLLLRSSGLPAPR